MNGLDMNYMKYCIILDSPRVSNPIPGIFVCDLIPRILEIEMPGMGSCSRSAKWAWDRLGGSCNRPLLGSRSLCLHTGLVRTTIGSLLQLWTSRCGDQGVVYCSRAQTIPCPFCWARTGTHAGHFNFKNPRYGITYQDPGLAAVTWLDSKRATANRFDSKNV